MRQRQLAAFAAAIALCAAATACGDDGGSTSSQAASTPAATTTTARKPANVAYVTYTYETFIKAEEKGLKSAVTPGGGSVTVFNGNFDVQKQMSACQDAITSGRYDVIALEPVATEAARPCVQAAKAAGIPVIGFGIPVGVDQLEPIDGVAGQVAITRQANAERYAQAVKQACEGLDPCKAIAEIAFPGDANSEAALKAAQEAVPSLDIMQKVVGQYDPAVIAKNFPDALAAHPDANVFMAAADTTALAVVPILQSSGKVDQVKIVGSGATTRGVQAVEDGEIVATTGSWPQTAGKAAGEMAIKVVNGQPIEPRGVDALALKEPGVINQRNAAQVKAEW